MRQLYYTLLTLLRGRGSNLVKLVSLTLGLLVGVLLFSQIVYELNYDKAYREHERLALFGARDITPEGEASYWEYDTWRPAAAALAESLPEQVECATPVFFWAQPDFYLEDKKLEKMQAIFGDTLYFRTMGVEVLKGDPQLLAQAGTAFLSRSKARELFGTQDPVGKTLSMDKRDVLTVRGVYEDLPGNVSFTHNILISLPTIEQYYGQGTWSSNDIYMIYLRLRRPEDLAEVNRRVTEVISHYTPVENRWNGTSLQCQVIPATRFYMESPDNVRRLVILSVLGFSIFFVSGMNYVLAAIATIGRRAKMVGVHKCCGADAGRVMCLFLWETALMMLAAIGCSLLLMYLFRDAVEDLLGISSIGELFTWQTLWVPALTVVLLFLVAGVLPGQMFARIPVTQVFRRYTDDKRSWKRGLLFVQFTGVAFILGMLITSVSQYHDLMTRSVGFRSEGLAVGTATGDLGGVTDDGDWGRAVDYILDDLKRQPFVEAVGRSEQNLLTHYSTTNQEAEGGKKYVHIHFQYFGNREFPEAVGLELVQGHWPMNPGEALVGESLVREMGWNDQVEGRKLGVGTTRWRRKGDEWQPSTVAGVVRDVRNTGFFSDPSNVAYVYDPKFNSTYHVRLKEPMRDNLLRLNDYVKQVYPQTGLAFLSYDDVRRDNNESVLRFRNTVYMTSACILLIVLMGLIGYVSDETQRRSKEIAVRKVNGAEAGDILRLLSVGILRVAIGAVLIGVAASWYMSGVWMEQFADSAMLSPLWFVLLFAVLLALIVLTVVLRAWRIANENPVLSLKSE